MKHLRQMATLAILLATFTAGSAYALSIGPAFSKFSSAAGSIDAVKQGTNTLHIIGANAEKVGGKPTIFVPGTGTVVDPTDPKFGAKCDGSTDDTTKIQAAIDYAVKSLDPACGQKSVPATLSCTATVQIPAAVCVVSQLSLPSRVVLKGQDWRSSVLIQKAGSNKHMIVLADPATTERVAVRDLYINGNKSNQVGPYDCIRFDNTGATNDRNHKISGVFTGWCSGNGITLLGPWGEDRVLDILSMSNDGYGVYSDVYDTMFSDIVAAKNGLDGVYLTGSNDYITNSKAWFNGSLNDGAGFRIAASRITYTGLDSQDNYGDGFLLSGETHTGNSLIADGNGKNFPNTGYLGSGFKLLNLTWSELQGVTKNLNEGLGVTQTYGVNIGVNVTHDHLDFVTNGDNNGPLNGTIDPSTIALINQTLYGSSNIAQNDKSNYFHADQQYEADAATVGGNLRSPKQKFASSYFDGATSQFLSWSIYNQPGTGTTPGTELKIEPPASGPGAAYVTIGTTGIAGPATGNFNSAYLTLMGSYWDGASAQYPKWNMRNIVGSGTTPTSKLEIWGGKTFTFDGTTGAFAADALTVNGTTLSNAPRMWWNAGTLAGALTSTATNTYFNFTPTVPVTLERIAWNVTTQGAGCTTPPVISAKVNGGTSALQATVANATWGGTADATVNVAAGQPVTVYVTTAAAGCSTAPANAYVGIQYRMQ